MSLDTVNEMVNRMRRFEIEKGAGDEELKMQVVALFCMQIYTRGRGGST